MARVHNSRLRVLFFTYVCTFSGERERDGMRSATATRLLCNGTSTCAPTYRPLLRVQAFVNLLCQLTLSTGPAGYTSTKLALCRKHPERLEYYHSACSSLRWRKQHQRHIQSNIRNSHRECNIVTIPYRAQACPSLHPPITHVNGTPMVFRAFLRQIDRV